MQAKIDDYVAQPSNSQSLYTAKAFISDPYNDPLFEESKGSDLGGSWNLHAERDAGNRKASEMSSTHSANNMDLSQTPSPKLSPRGGGDYHQGRQMFLRSAGKDSLEGEVFKA